MNKLLEAIDNLDNYTTNLNFLITNIDWETDDEEIDLPTEVTVSQEDASIEDINDMNEIEERLNNYLSNTYGYLVNGYSYEIIGE